MRLGGANEWAQRSARMERAVQMSERCEQTSERVSEWPSILRVDFKVILLIVERRSCAQIIRAIFAECERVIYEEKTSERMRKYEWGKDLLGLES